jgi:hypothetical protein
MGCYVLFWYELSGFSRKIDRISTDDGRSSAESWGTQLRLPPADLEVLQHYRMSEFPWSRWYLQLRGTKAPVAPVAPVAYVQPMLYDYIIDIN